jgi:hypothetical protein
MTGNDVPPSPRVLNTTVLSNFAYIDQVHLLAGLSGICAVPIVQEEPHDGVGDHLYLKSALDSLNDGIPITPISETVANPETFGSSYFRHH